MLRQFRGQVSFAARCIIVSASWCALAGDNPAVLQPHSRNAVREGAIASNIRVDTSLVLIPVAVTDALNRPVIGLGKNDFHVFEGKVEQQLLHVTFEDAPLAVGLLFDSSGSMERKMPKSLEAISELLKTANPEDEFFLVEFNDTARVAHGLTSAPGDIQSQLLFTRPKGRTALLDAIALGMKELKKAKAARKALVIISDGGDNRSRYSATEIRHMAAESDAVIYAMGIFETGAARLSAEEIAGPDLLNDIADRSGGKLFTVQNLRDLPSTAARIAAELHSRYILGYAPTGLQRDGKYHRVLVQVAPSKGITPLHVDSRSGYRAPTD